jgi:hypothetical protein
MGGHTPPPYKHRTHRHTPTPRRRTQIAQSALGRRQPPLRCCLWQVAPARWPFPPLPNALVSVQKRRKSNPPGKRGRRNTPHNTPHHTTPQDNTPHQSDSIPHLRAAESSPPRRAWFSRTRPADSRRKRREGFPALLQGQHCGDKGVINAQEQRLNMKLVVREGAQQATSLASASVASAVLTS